MIMISEPAGPLRLVTDTDAFLGEDTPLARAAAFGGRPYEPRPQQRQMALAVAEALGLSANLCVEAPTGVGKSFAYLIPAILYATRQKFPVVVSTETINLQEQLFTKDLPLLRQILNLEFRAALAKGRGNYLCLRRLAQAGGERQNDFLPLKSLVPDVEKLWRWSEQTEDGSLSDLDIEIDSRAWDCVKCEGGNCFGPKCQHFRDCFYWAARKSWEKADILVANHALFLTDLKTRLEGDMDDGLLPNYSAVVIDEAHQLEDNATRNLGARAMEIGLYMTLRRLFDAERGRGLLLQAGEEPAVLRQLVKDAGASAAAFFRSVRDALKDRKDSVCRIYKPHFVEDIVAAPFVALEKALADYIKKIEDDNRKIELESRRRQCQGYRETIHAFLNMSMPNSVYWTELDTSSSGPPRVSLNISPLNVAEILSRHVFAPAAPVILTSATLAVSEKLDYYKKRVGFTGRELVVDSPFDYRTQAAVYIRKDLPTPGDDDHAPALSREILRYLRKTHGKALVLFTSYKALLYAANDTRQDLEKMGLKLLVQGERRNRSALLQEFRDDIHSVLYGTTSFWMGVDVPGEALSNVIITKLPFPVPSDPVIEARLEKLKEEGRNGFMEYSLPETVIRFKQGVGRLIRGKTDRGIIVLLDHRVITKRYGKIFINSLPPCPVFIE